MMNVRKIALCAVLALCLMPSPFQNPTAVHAQSSVDIHAIEALANRIDPGRQQRLQQQQQMRDIGMMVFFGSLAFIVVICIAHLIWQSTKAKCSYCKAIVAPDVSSCPKCGKANPTEKKT